MNGQGWRPVRLFTLSRLETAGWTWLADPRRGPSGRALRSPRGTVYEVRTLPLGIRRYEEVRFADAA